MLFCSKVFAEELYQFEIKSQTADVSLTEFADQADLTLVVPFDKMSRIVTRELQGRYSISHGIELLLEDTKLQASVFGKQLKITLKQETRGDSIMKKDKILKLSLVATALAATTVNAQEAQTSQESAVTKLEEIVTIGVRSGVARSVSDSPVPVDVITADDLSSIGGTVDITDNLQALIPSYTATPLTGDGSAFVRTTSLRGLSPDQTLVLVNGKRRHRSALIQFAAPAAGGGSHAPDVAMIPSIALKNVQVLRDGAAAQYGSDAIAGVIDFQLKDAAEGSSFVAQFGEHFEGESNFKIAVNSGFSLGEDGFLNLSFEHIDNDALSRGVQTSAGQTLIDAGVQGVGADSPFDDSPRTQTWGRPESSGTRVFFNLGTDIGESAEFYSFGNFAKTEARTRFFFRRGLLPSGSIHPAIAGLIATNPELGSNPFPAGFTPFLDGDQTDISLVAGIKGTFSNDIDYDFSIGYGKNELDYFLNNTVNPGLRATTVDQVQRNFDVGGQEQEEINFNADFSKQISDNMNLAFGAEWREESFGRSIGEPNSYIGSDGSVSFTSGFASPTPRSATTESRDNVALYLDLEHDISDSWLMQYAVRAEDFSDFGSTVNFKVATNIDVSDKASLRAAVSTGFHAPTPGQANVSSILTTIDPSGATNDLIEVGLVPANSAEAAEVGGGNLKEEESVGVSVGAVFSLSDTTDLTIDAYKIEVDDRIYQTPQVPVPNGGGAQRSFFTNALDVETSGLDLVLTTAFGPADISFAYSYNTVDVSGVRDVVTPNGTVVTPVSPDTAEDIENNFPEHRFTLTSDIALSANWNLLLRGRYFGDHFDERGNIAGTAGAGRSAEIDGILFVDAELGYNFSDNLTLTLGATNLFDEYPDELRAGSGFANRESVGLLHPRRSPVGYNGGSYYLRANYNF